jgi:uncharacterized membrane protein
MALVRRILIILLALMTATVVSALVIALAMMLEWEQILAMTTGGGGWLVVGFVSLILSAKGVLPAALVIALAEGFALRSPLFYAAAGGLGLVAL